MPETRPVLVVDLGAQYAQLIARRVRECHVYSEIVAHDLSASQIALRRPAGIILSGGPASVYESGGPQVDPGLFSLGVPVLGICYGHQLMARALHLGSLSLSTIWPGVPWKRKREQSEHLRRTTPRSSLILTLISFIS